MLSVKDSLLLYIKKHEKRQIYVMNYNFFYWQVCDTANLRIGRLSVGTFSFDDFLNKVVLTKFIQSK